jgi:uncharacterized membrane protein
MELLIIGIIIYLILLSRRVATLEIKLRQQGGNASVSPIPPPTTPPPPLYSDIPAAEPNPLIGAFTPAVTAPTTFAPITPPPAESPFIVWLKKDFLVKLGAFLLLLALGWFVSYAFTNNWIGPFGRIVLGLALGVGIMSLGVWRIQTLVHQGSIFVALGSGTVFLTMYAARYLYNFFTPGTALFIMFLSVVCAGYIAVIKQTRGLAIASLILGAVAPLLTNSPEPSVVGLFSYLLALILGAIVVTGLLQAEVLILIALFIVFFYSLPFSSPSSLTPADMQIATLFGFLFTIIFFFTNIISILRRNDNQPHPAHIAVGAVTGLFVSYWIKVGSIHEWEGILFTVWAMVFAAGAYMVFARSKRGAPFYIYGAVAIGLLGAATAAFLSGPALAIAYTLEVTALVVLAARLIEADAVTQRVAFLYGMPIVLSLEHIFASDWQHAVLHKHFAVLAVLMVSLFAAAVSLLMNTSVAKRQVGGVLAALGGVYGLILIARILLALLEDQLAWTLTLGIYAAIGSLLYMIGLRLSKYELSRFGAFVGVSHIPLLFATLPHLYASSWHSAVWHTDFAALFFVTTVFWLTGAAATQRTVRQQSLLPAKVLLALAGSYSLALVWLIAHALLTVGIATTLCLVFYTLVGLGLYIFGKVKGHKYVALCGAAVITGVVMRLLGVELWALSVTARIITFFIIGILLISTAFITKLQKQ